MKLPLRPLLLPLAAAAGLFAAAPARADGVLINSLNPHCPKCKHCFEGPPKIKFKPGCPRPCCDPHDLQHFGYYPTCWSKWPFPPDWSHCLVPPPGAIVPPHPGKMPIPDQPAGDRQSLPDVERTPQPRQLLDMSYSVPLPR